MQLKKEGSILNHSHRLFIFQDRGRFEPRWFKEGYVVQTWSGRVSKIGDEPKGPLDAPITDLTILKIHASRNLPLESWHWAITNTERDNILLRGVSKSKLDAAEDLYHGWYNLHTQSKFREARMPAANKEVVLLGNWITADEYHGAEPSARERATVIPDVQQDGRLFVLSWTKAATDKARTRIAKCSYQSRLGIRDPEPFQWKIELESGVKLSESLDWYVFKPENLITGEVYCSNCRSAIGSTQSIGMLWVRTIGALCGPCLDYKAEQEGLPDDLWDALV